MNVIAKALMCATAAAALSAHAQQAGSPSPSGPYVGAGLGYGQYKGPALGGLDTDKSGTGGKAYFGYEFHPNLAVEAGYADLGEAKSAAGSARGRGVFLDAVGKWPVGESFSVLGRLGAFHGKAKTNLGDTDRDTTLKYGLGAQYDFTPQMSLRGEWERYRYNVVDTKVRSNLYSIGVNYKF